MDVVAADAIMRAVASGAGVVLCGSCYALFLGVAYYSDKRRWLFPAYFSYAGLILSVVILAHALNFTGYWWYLVATMLVGYLLAPHAIWHLCVGTHQAADHAPDTSLPSTNNNQEITNQEASI